LTFKGVKCYQKNEVFAILNVNQGGKTLSRNNYFFSPFYEVSLRPTKIRILNVTQVSNLQFRISLYAPAVALFTWVETKFNGKFNENGILLIANETKRILFTSEQYLSAQDLASSLKVTTLVDTYT
jgi:hypothetical protein